MRIIMKSERQVEGGFKKYLLKYELIANGFLKDEGEGTYYGVTVEQFVWSQEKRAWERYDSAEVAGFSESLKESMLFFEKIVKGDVMPVCLENIVDDWKSAFCLDNKESA